MDWREGFQSYNSPYFHMYTCGLMGIPIELVVMECQSKGIALRKKDIKNWENGWFKHNHSNKIEFNINTPAILEYESTTLDSFCDMPDQWRACDKRWFPCTHENKPMQPWGYQADFTPQLWNKVDAQAISPCGWVGQNIFHQPFIVIDIDGVGHGTRDEQAIEFGTALRHQTLCYEDPNKLGSFHLYFKTRKIIPIRHFSYAKIDLMGNATNAAVYMKNKKSNGVPMDTLTEEVWQYILNYVNKRKKESCSSAQVRTIGGTVPSQRIQSIPQVSQVQ